MAKKANDYMAVADTWQPEAGQFKEVFDEYKRWVGAPNGTEWTGRTSNAAYDTASTDCHSSDNTNDTAEDASKLVAATIQYEVVDPLVNGQRLIERVLEHKDQGVSIDQQYHVEYHPAEGESDDSIAKNREHVADIERQIKEYVAKWEKGCQTLKAQADAAAQKITGCINPKTALVDGRKVLRDAVAQPTAGDPNAASIDYKKEYPKATNPASVDPGAGTFGDSVQHIKNPPTTPTAATAPVDPNAPQYGPFAKDTIDKTKVGGLGESVTYLNRNDKPPEEHKPSAAERFKTNISEGIDKGVDKLIAPFTDLRDRLGLGDKGFWEANEEAGRREWESFKHQMTTPPGADIAEGIKHNIENPGQYFGGKLVDGGALMAGGPEGLLPRAGLEGSAAAHLGTHPDLPSPGALHDTPAPAHTVEPPSGANHPAPVVDHPSPTVDHPTGHLPPHGEPGSFGYDDDGNRLRYANGRPPYGSTQEVDVWNQSREDQLQRIDNQDLNLPRPGDDQQWTLLHPNGPIGDDWTVENGHRLVDWQEGQLRDGLWDMGHDGGLEYRKLRELYLSHQIDFDEFIRQHQNHENYSVQDPYRNRSHIDEHP
ncbi:GH-E family nuclease [Mycobacteroides chelonae]|uniref:GH-E family nuclease n=1 Tax=Mycobacteroides chelonae TaxID=1774 RepID=UPI000993AD16|nr:GH-E family nuclease [Mycobacteroides chelonae]